MEIEIDFIQSITFKDCLFLWLNPPVLTRWIIPEIAENRKTEIMNIACLYSQVGTNIICEINIPKVARKIVR